MLFKYVFQMSWILCCLTTQLLNRELIVDNTKTRISGWICSLLLGGFKNVGITIMLASHHVHDFSNDHVMYAGDTEIERSWSSAVP